MGAVRYAGHYCADSCVCLSCHNTQDHKDLVTQTIAYTRSRNPASFEAKVGVTQYHSNDHDSQGESKRKTPLRSVMLQLRKMTTGQGLQVRCLCSEARSES